MATIVSKSFEKFYAYKILALIAKPFTDWEAFKLGLIDEKGKKLRQPKTEEESAQFSQFLNIVRNIKKVINKSTFGKESKLSNLLVGTMLLREELSCMSYNMDVEVVHDTLFEELTKLIGMETIESAMYSNTIPRGRYMLRSEFYDENPILYIKEEIQEAVDGRGIFIVSNSMGKHYWVSETDLMVI